MNLFCRHEWDYIKRKTDPQIDKQGNIQYAQIRIGVCVYCRKCGKQHRRLSKTMSKLYATHTIHEMENDILESVVEKSKQLPKNY